MRIAFCNRPDVRQSGVSDNTANMWCVPWLSDTCRCRQHRPIASHLRDVTASNWLCSAEDVAALQNKTQTFENLWRHAPKRVKSTSGELFTEKRSVCSLEKLVEHVKAAFAWCLLDNTTLKRLISVRLIIVTVRNDLFVFCCILDQIANGWLVSV